MQILKSEGVSGILLPLVNYCVQRARCPRIKMKTCEICGRNIEQLIDEDAIPQLIHYGENTICYRCSEEEFYGIGRVRCLKL